MVAAVTNPVARVSVASSQLRLWTLACLAVWLSGCGTLGQYRLSEGGWSLPKLPWSDSKKDPYGRAENDVVGPLQRLSMLGKKTLPQTEEDRKHAAVLKTGRDLFDDQKYAAAQESFELVVKERDPEKFSFKKLFTLSDSSDRPVYDPLRAEALFYTGESMYQQKNLRRARDNYKVVVKDYPSTQYVDRSAKRLFDIAREWLGNQEFATANDLQQVNLEEPGRATPVPTSQSPHRWYHVNPTDKTRPVLDTNGYAIDALRTIWTYDSTGPLADDALMLAATHHLREGDNVEADRLFTLLREQFPKSQHLQAAFVLGSHVKLASYQGPSYEEEQLEDAAQLKESILRLFPDAPEADRVRGELKAIYEARALRVWEKAQFWEKKNKPKAVAVYLRQVIEEFPETKYAAMARTRLAELGQPIDRNIKDRYQPSVEPLRQFRSESDEEVPDSTTADSAPEPAAPRKLFPSGLPKIGRAKL